MFFIPKFIFSKFLSSDEKGFNTTFFITQYFELLGFKVFKSMWVGKISFKLSVINDPNVSDVPDMDQRSMLAYQLARVLDIKVPEIKMIRLDAIEGSKKILDNIDPSKNNDFTSITVSKCVGKRVSNISEANKNDLLRLYIFDCWIGNLDKKIGDYVMDKWGGIWGIDYQLWGPIDTTHKTLGYCGRLYNLSTENLKRYCFPRNSFGMLQYNEAVADNLLKKIDSLQDETIKKIVNKYNFYSPNKNSLNTTMVDYLLLRKKHISSDIKSIFN